MRIGRQSAATDFLAKPVQLIFGKPPFEVGAGIDAGRRVSLDEYEIAAMLVRGRSPEMVEADFVHRGR